MRLLVTGKIFTRGGLVDASVMVENGRITKIAKVIQEPADQVLDYHGKGRIVLPGLIDMHVHMRDFEYSHKEDFFTGTSAAAMGGFTVVADMPNTRPRVNRPDVLARREKVASNKSLVDYALYYGVPEREEDLRDEIQELAIGFKIFMQHEFYTDRRPLSERVLEFASRKNMPVVVHAENPKFFVETEMGPVGTPEAEASAIRDIAGAASDMGFPLHVTHTSSEAGLRELTAWRDKTKLTADTCPYYLLLNAEKARKMGGIGKVHPPIKSSRDSEALMRGLKDGRIDAIVSDHAPHPLEEKRDPRTASPGFPGLETTLPLLLTLVNRKVLEVEDVVRACAVSPSRILGLAGVGSIEEGKLGNLTVVDLHRKGRIDPQTFASKGKYSPFEGMEVEGAALATVVRGEPVMLNGEIVGTKGWGKNVKTWY